jgi:DNA-binding transcriptional MerR regulator
MRVMDELSSEELADRSGMTAEQLRRLVELGIITPTFQGRFRPSDIQRSRVVDTLADAGFAPEQLSELIATGAYDLDWASVVFPEPTAQLTTTLEETAVLRAEAALERAGLARRRPVGPPAIAFLDLTGYTRLTEERGDRAAAELAGRLVEIVHEVAHRQRPGRRRRQPPGVGPLRARRPRLPQGPRRPDHPLHRCPWWLTLAYSSLGSHDGCRRPSASRSA